VRRSSGAKGIENAPQRVRVDLTIDAYQPVTAKIDLHQTQTPRTLHFRLFRPTKIQRGRYRIFRHSNRDENRTRIFFELSKAFLTPPLPKAAIANTIATRNFRNRHASLFALRNNPPLIGNRNACTLPVFAVSRHLKTYSLPEPSQNRTAFRKQADQRSNKAALTGGIHPNGRRDLTIAVAASMFEAKHFSNVTHRQSFGWHGILLCSGEP
jgi:hypothetical protein